MAPARGSNEVGEKLAALHASFEAEKEYQHDRWHKLDNDLTPVVNLPERLTREIGKLQGLVEGKITSVSKELERSMEAAIQKAVKPVSDKVATLESKVETLESARTETTTLRKFGDYLIHLIMSAVVAVATVLALRHS